MDNEDIKQEFDKAFENIVVSEKLKEKTFERINRQENKIIITARRIASVAAVLIITFGAIVMYMFNKELPVIENKQEKNIFENNIIQKGKSAEKEIVIDKPEISQYSSTKEKNDKVISEDKSTKITNLENSNNGESILLELTTIIEEETLEKNSDTDKGIMGSPMKKLRMTTDEIEIGDTEADILDLYPQAVKNENTYVVEIDGEEKVYIVKDGIVVEIK